LVTSPVNTRHLIRLTALVFLLNLVSALVFIILVNRPVYDDEYNIVDVHNYAKNGLSQTALQAHRNAPGPVSFLWMAGFVRLLGGSELRDARIGALLSWVCLTIGVLACGHFSSSKGLWYAALLAVLVFPHSVEASATVLTEGPALLFALMGALAWTEFVSGRSASLTFATIGIMGGLFMGLSVTCRQYNLALLPAAGFLAVYQFRKNERHDASSWATVAASLAMAALPVTLLVLAWKGMSSPGMASGASYQNWRAAVGLSFSRPVIAAFYAALYLFPFTFPLTLRFRSVYRKWLIAVAILGSGVAAYFMRTLLQPGPLASLIRFASHVPILGSAIFLLLAMIAIYNSLVVGSVLWTRRDRLVSSVPLAFALLIIFFFVVEQFGVGGNIPFYDRYILQIAPFLGLVAFSILPQLDRARIFVLLALSVLSHFMLWRYAV
jgi:hypothetical protein